MKNIEVSDKAVFRGGHRGRRAMLITLVCSNKDYALKTEFVAAVGMLRIKLKSPVLKQKQFQN